MDGPLAALGVASATVLVGRQIRARGLASAAGGLAVAAGWAFAGPAADPAHAYAHRLVVLAAVAAAIGAGLASLAPRRGMLPGAVALALFCGWWLAGGPRDHPGAAIDWPAIAGIAGLVLLVARGMAGAAEPAGLAAAVTLAAGFWLAGASWGWVVLALVLAVAALAPAVGPAIGAAAGMPALLPLAADLAALAAAALLGAYRRPGGLVSVGIATAAPVGVLFLAPRVLPRLRRAGPAAPFLAAAAAAAASLAAAAGALWCVRRALHPH